MVDHSPGRSLLPDCLSAFIHGHTRLELERSESGRWSGCQWFCGRCTGGVGLSRTDSVAVAKLWFRRSKTEQCMARDRCFRSLFQSATRFKCVCRPRGSAGDRATGVVVSSRGCICMLTNRWRIDLTGCCLARRHECVRSREQARGGDPAFCIRRGRAGLRPIAVVPLRRDSFAEGAAT